MFSPSQNNTTPTVRTSRRRARPLSNEANFSLPKAKRQRSARSALSDTTFTPPDGAPEMEETKASTVARRESVREPTLPAKEMVVRGKKSRSADRGSKGDGSVVLTTNDTYTVSKLPALPDRLRADVTGRQHGAIYSDSGYALTLTHTHAIVWPYSVNIPSPETFSFALPEPSKHVSDPLPIGSLVSASASSSDPGLVVVVPTSGKVTYWESISSAATLDLRLQRNGVDLTIPGMYNGETVIQILNAESAGFVLAFSTGRIAYMSVRDGQGRPAISVQFLRGSSGPVNSGLFGTLRNALSSSSWRGDIAAVRAGRQEKVGERNVVIATAKGKIQSWEIHRGGHNSLNAEAEGREAIVMAIKASAPALSDLLIESFELLDITFTPKSPMESQLTDSDDSGIHLLLLASLAGRYNNTHYFLVEIVLKRSELSVGNIRPIKSYTTPISQTATSRARLYLPNPALVAYVVFDRAVVVISMAKQPDSPDLQLRTESHLLPQSFEDVVDFRQDMNVEIVGSGLEEPQVPSHSIEDSKSRRHKAKYPATVLIVRGGGVIRVAATDITKLASSRAQQVTAKSKLEQAVFFGTLDQNPLNFAVRAELQFPDEEVGAAALELSRNILKSETPYIPSVPASIDQNLRKRSASLCDLAKYLKASGVQLDRVTRWKLLWDAEKMTAASIIWKRYDDTLKGKPAGQKRGLLAELVECIHEEYKTEPVPESGELDRVRQWFIKDIWNLEIAVPWAFQVIKYTFQDGQKEHSFIAEILSEANDLVLGALQGAFAFRTANLNLYGLGAEELEYGILKEHFDGLPEFWTSTHFITENTRKQAELAGQLVKEYYPISDKSGAPSPVVVNKVRHEYSDLIDVAIRSSRERMRWSSVQESPKTQLEAEQLSAVQEIAQDEQILLLAGEIDLPDEAIALAEKHGILPTLATVLRWQIERFSPKSREPGADSETMEMMETRFAMLRHQVRHCFAKFGAKWATALFEQEICNGLMADLLDELPDQQEYLTTFLRSKPEYAKVSWINEITREKDFGQASKTLLELGLQREQDVWSKKIELSMGKLALLANRSNSQGKDALLGAKVELTSTEDELALIKIQDQIYDIIRPVINAAIDENAELELALQGYGNQGLKKQQALLSLLEDSMGHLIKHEAMDARTLIDLLTLMSDNGHYDEFLRSEQFYLALQASRHGLPKDEQLLTRRVIWRRCMLVDNWVEVNDTDQKYDEQVSEQLRRTALYMTFRACLKNRLFDKDSTIKPMSPGDVLGACTEELDQRFAGLDASIRDSIVRDMQVEDENLKPFIETSRLGKWYHAALELARDDFKLELDEQTDDGEKMKQAEKTLAEIEEGIKESEKRKAEDLLHSKPRYKLKSKVSGSLGNFRSSIKQY